MTAARDGFVTAFDTMRLGLVVIGLGGGRNVAEDTVDPSVGIDLLKKRGDRVSAGDTLASVAANTQQALATAVTAITESILIGDTAPAAVPLVLEIIR